MARPAPKPLDQAGFTVGELVVVVVILIVLSLLALPTIRGYFNEPVPEPETAFVVIEAPAIEGVPRVGQALAADPGQWTPEGIFFSFQWQRCPNTGPCETIATGSRYIAQVADRGQRLRVQVTGRNAGLSLTIPSPLTDTVS
jgi:hypothetical protein